MPRKHRNRLTAFLQSPQTCGEKRRYTTQTQARQVAEEQELLNPGLRLRVYKCVAGCGGWHLTRHKDVL